MRLTTTIAFLALILAPLAGTAFGAPPTDPVPCSDPRGCPDLIVDGTRLAPFLQQRTFSETSCAVEEGMVASGARTLLRFTSTTPNIGAGDMVVGSPSAHPEWFEYAKCHGHHHFRSYADYRLWQPTYYTLWTTLRDLQPDTPPDELLASTPLLRDGFVAGNKLGFCFIDLVQYTPGVPSKFRSCGDQGISAGWADTYSSSLDGQWIDVTGVPRGSYVLEVEVNAKRWITESDFRNNAVGVTVTV